jgi:hypothetical protein
MLFILEDLIKSKWVMEWIEKGYDLVWVTTPPIAKEMPNL